MEGIAVQDIAMKGIAVGFFAVLVRFSGGNFHTYILLMSGCSILNVLTFLYRKMDLLSPYPLQATLLNELYKTRVQ